MRSKRGARTTPPGEPSQWPRSSAIRDWGPIPEPRCTLRGLVCQPLAAAVAVATLSLGLASVTALFAVTDAVILQPVGDSDSRLVRVWKDDVVRGSGILFPLFGFARRGHDVPTGGTETLALIRCRCRARSSEGSACRVGCALCAAAGLGLGEPLAELHERTPHALGLVPGRGEGNSARHLQPRVIGLIARMNCSVRRSEVLHRRPGDRPSVRGVRGFALSCPVNHRAPAGELFGDGMIDDQRVSPAVDPRLCCHWPAPSRGECDPQVQDYDKSGHRQDPGASRDASRTAPSDPAAVVGPVQHCLALPRATVEVARRAVRPNGPYMPANRLPAGNLPRVVVAAPAHVVAAVPLEPAAGVLRVNPALAPPFAQRQRRVHAEAVELRGSGCSSSQPGCETAPDIICRYDYRRTITLTRCWRVPETWCS